jgi:uncharacterized protein (TIGR00251 family)
MTALPRVEPSPDGRSCRLFVRAQPGARRSGLAGLWNDRLKVALRSPPEDGRANAELLDVLAEALDLRPAQLALVRGDRSRLKEVAVALPAEAVRSRLRAKSDEGLRE